MNSVFVQLLITTLIFPGTKKDGPERISPLGAVEPGDVLLSHNLEMHYHRGCSVSLPCSGWERVGPPRYDHQRTEPVSDELRIPGL